MKSYETDPETRRLLLERVTFAELAGLERSNRNRFAGRRRLTDYHVRPVIKRPGLSLFYSTRRLFAVTANRPSRDVVRFGESANAICMNATATGTREQQNRIRRNGRARAITWIRVEHVLL